MNYTVAEDPWKTQLEAFGSFVRTQRQLAKLSLRELAELARVSNPYLSQIERGLHEPSIRVVQAIAKALDISTETLLAQVGLVGDGDVRGACPRRHRGGHLGRPVPDRRAAGGAAGRLPQLRGREPQHHQAGQVRLAQSQAGATRGREPAPPPDAGG